MYLRGNMSIDGGRSEPIHAAPLDFYDTRRGIRKGFDLRLLCERTMRLGRLQGKDNPAIPLVSMLLLVEIRCQLPPGCTITASSRQFREVRFPVLSPGYLSCRDFLW